MPRRLILHPPSVQFLVGVGATSLTAYAGSAIVKRYFEDTRGAPGVAAEFGHDFLLAISVLALGAGGIAGWTKGWRDRQLSKHAGGLLLGLLHEVDHLGGRLTALIWEPCRPLSDKPTDLRSGDVWGFLKHSPEGRMEVLYGLWDTASASLYPDGDEVPLQVMKAVGFDGARNAAAAAAAAETLHARAVEFSDHRYRSADEFLAATATLRSETAEWLETAETAAKDPVRLFRSFVGFNLTAITSLGELAEAIAAATAETEKALKRSKEGREALKHHREQAQLRTGLMTYKLDVVKILHEIHDVAKED